MARRRRGDGRRGQVQESCDGRGGGRGGDRGVFLLPRIVRRATRTAVVVLAQQVRFFGRFIHSAGHKNCVVRYRVTSPPGRFVRFVVFVDVVFCSLSSFACSDFESFWRTANCLRLVLTA